MSTIIFILKKMIQKIYKKIYRIIGKLKQIIYLPYQYIYLKRCNSEFNRFSIKLKNRWICLGDNTTQDTFDRHYVYHCAWAARVVKKINPIFHTDISSSVNFISIASAFVPIKFYDYRPIKMSLDGLDTDFANLQSLNFEDESIQSLSCMHVIEHIGLGRYGDKLDYDGDIKAINELKRVVTKGGSLILVIPISGENKIQFNAHRVYTYTTILNFFPNFNLEEFSLITDDCYLEQPFIRNAKESDANAQIYGCGCFHFIKKYN